MTTESEKVLLHYIIEVTKQNITSVEERVRRLLEFAIAGDIQTLKGLHFVHDRELDKMIQSLGESGVKNVCIALIPLIGDLIKEAKERSVTEVLANADANEYQLKEENAAIKAKLKNMKSKKSNSTKYIVYFLLLFIIAMCLTVYAVYVSHGVANVTIQYNVGEIIGAILAGIGIAAAGTAYASKTFNEMDKE